MHTTLVTLIDRLEDATVSDTNVIPWGCPVPSFGDLSQSRIATVGLNPSNREFVDNVGNELNGELRRFHTLTSLGLKRWSDISSVQLGQIADFCRTYFTRNPYHRWFKELDHVISGTNTTYYDSSAQACHLDLIPYATKCKWTELTSGQRSALLTLSGDTLGLLLKDSPVRLLILNGQTVINNLQEISGAKLTRRAMRSWTLPRRSGQGVVGYAFRGEVRELGGIKLKRKIHVLGFNHNLQSSFGVTRVVKARIRDWIAKTSQEAVS